MADSCLGILLSLADNLIFRSSFRTPTCACMIFYSLSMTDSSSDQLSRVQLATNAVTKLESTLNGIPCPPTSLLLQVLAAKTLLERLQQVPDSLNLGSDVLGMITSICRSCSDVQESVDDHARSGSNNWMAFYPQLERRASYLQLLVATLTISAITQLRSATTDPSLFAC